MDSGLYPLQFVSERLCRILGAGKYKQNKNTPQPLQEGYLGRSRWVGQRWTMQRVRRILQSMQFWPWLLSLGGVLTCTMLHRVHSYG